MNNYKRSISVFIGIAILMCCFPVFVYADYISSVSNFWDYLVLETDLITGNGLLQNLIGSVSSDAYCSGSDDNHHHGDQVIGNSGEDSNGRFTYVHCDYCGDNFKCYASDLNDAYDAYVGTLPADCYVSDNTLIWRPKVSLSSPPNGYSANNHIYTSIPAGNPCYGTVTRDSASSGYTGFILNPVYAPIPGQYTPYIRTSSSSDFVAESGIGCSVSATYPNSITLPQGTSRVSFPDEANLTKYYYYEVYYIIEPFQTILETINNYYVSQTRINQNITLNVTDNTQTTNYNDVTIVNETTNKYYNISNNTYLDISNWRYDYTNRKYTMTMQDNTTVTVQFGNDYITVVEGGETKTYYYTAPVAPEPTPSPSPTPEPTPSPSPTPDPNAFGNDYDTTGVLPWLIDWWEDFSAWLVNLRTFFETKFQVIIEGIQIITNNTENNNTDIDITYDNDTQDIVITNNNVGEGEDPEEDSFNLRADFLSKFLIFKDIYDIGNGLINIVASDAAYAYEFGLDSVVGAGGDAAVASYALEDGGELLAEGDEPVMLMSAGSPNIPSIEINMGAATSNYGYNYGGTTAVLDLSWYTPYKSTVDNLLSGFLWIGFAWALFKRAPGIIGGVSLTSERGDDIDAGKKGGGRR